MLQAPNPKLNELQLNLMKTFAYITDKEELNEIDLLINYYLEKKLDRAIESVESERGYTAEIYEQWLSDKDQTSGR